MGLVSGTSGVLTFNSVNLVMTNVKLNRSAAIDKFAHSASSGVKTGVVGSRDANGSATLKLDGPPPAEGTVATMVVKHGDFDGVGERTYTFTAAISKLDIEIDVDSGRAVSANIEFEVISAITEASV